MTINLTKSFVQRAIADSTWDLGNKVLYDLCKQNPFHRESGVIGAKIWLIGRSYAAAIERRREKGNTTVNDEFYETVVIPQIKASRIDRWFQDVTHTEDGDVAALLEVHWRLTELFERITKQSKRSLASKYLHFHFPDRYFIYDSRASFAIRQLTESMRNRLPSLSRFDEVYGRFFLRCSMLREKLSVLVGRNVNPRELDKVLLAWVRMK